MLNAGRVRSIGPGFSRLQAAAWLARWLGVVAISAGVLMGFVRFHVPGHGFTYVLDFGATLGLERLPEVNATNPYVHDGVPGYDGAYYAQLALRPAVADPALAGAIDNVPYRARRMAMPWLAWSLGTGDPGRVITVFSLINLGAWFALGALLLRWFPMAGLHDWLRWAGVMLSAGLLGSLRHALTDGPVVLAIAGAVALVEMGRPWLAAALGGVAGLVRETGVLTAAVLAPERLRPLGAWWMAAARSLLIVAPLLLWLFYLRLVWPDQFDTGGGFNNFTWPLAGFVDRWVFLFGAVSRNGWTEPYASSLLVHLGLTVQVAVLVAVPRWSSAWWRVGAVHLVLMMVLDVEVWEGYPGASSRVLLPLLVAFNVLAPRTRLGLVWVLAGNLGVVAGYNEMRPPPVPTAIVSGPNEWLVQRVGGARVEVRFSSDFFSPESYGGHAWRWTSTGGSLGLSNPHGVPLESRVEIGLRAPSPRQVELRFDGRTVWSGTVAESLVRVDLGRQTILAEDSRLDVVTGPPDPPVGDQPPLAVAVYDVRIAIVGPAEETARELLFQGR